MDAGLGFRFGVYGSRSERARIGTADVVKWRVQHLGIITKCKLEAVSRSRSQVGTHQTPNIS